MLPGLGFSEIVLIGVIALLVVGPRDLPLMLRKFGRFTARMRGLANEFRAGFDELARQAELDELRREVDALRRGQLLDSEEINDIRRQMSEVVSETTGALPPPPPQPVPDPAPDAATSEATSPATDTGQHAAPLPPPGPDLPQPVKAQAAP